MSSAVSDGDIVATKPLATTEDTPPVVLISDFRVRKVRRLGVLIGDGNIFAVKPLETTKDGTCVLPFTAPRVVGDTIERLVSCTVSFDAEPGSSVVHVVTTEDEAGVSPFTAPIVVGEGMTLLVSCTVTTDAEPVFSLLVVLILVAADADAADVAAEMCF